MLEKRNVVAQERTPEPEYTRPDEDWDKSAADLFVEPIEPQDKPDKPGKEDPAVN